MKDILERTVLITKIENIRLLTDFEKGFKICIDVELYKIFQGCSFKYLEKDGDLSKSLLGSSFRTLNLRFKLSDLMRCKIFILHELTQDEGWARFGSHEYSTLANSIFISMRYDNIKRFKNERY